MFDIFFDTVAIMFPEAISLVFYVFEGSATLSSYFVFYWFHYLRCSQLCCEIFHTKLMRSIHNFGCLFHCTYVIVESALFLDHLYRFMRLMLVFKYAYVIDIITLYILISTSVKITSRADSRECNIKLSKRKIILYPANFNVCPCYLIIYAQNKQSNTWQTNKTK